MFTCNGHASRGPYPAELRQLMNSDRAKEGLVWLSHWREFAPVATPLFQLPDLSKRLGLASVNVKDESGRSSLGSFKALGAPVALVRLVIRLHPGATLGPSALFAGLHKELLQDFTVISATDGNHGRALAAAAQAMGCRCAIVLHAQVSPERENAIAAQGAKIIRITGNYDDSVDQAAQLAANNGWHLVSDTSYEGYEEIPRDVMQGYAAIAAELVAQTDAKAGQRAPFTHVFLQGGVGGLAAGVSSFLWEYFAANRPRFIVVEPDQADCLLQSALKGRAESATGSIDSVMAGLACGETSPLAWRFLEPVIDHFMTISDDDAIGAMRALAVGSSSDIPIVAGESGGAGLAGLLRLRQDEELSNLVGLDAAARVICINTEGATAPSVYRRITGESADSVMARQADWKNRGTPESGWNGRCRPPDGRGY
jgi:diaminopropionate ammonia-lyase